MLKHSTVLSVLVLWTVPTSADFGSLALVKALKYGSSHPVYPVVLLVMLPPGPASSTGP